MGLPPTVLALRVAIGIPMKPFEQLYLRLGKAGMPDVHYDHDAVGSSVVPGLVFEVIIEHEAPTLLPGASLAAVTDSAVALRHDDAEVAPQPEVCSPTMGGYMSAGT